MQWYRGRTSDCRGGTRKTMIVALARKLLIALWRLVTTGEIPQGFIPRPALYGLAGMAGHALAFHIVRAVAKS